MQAELTSTGGKPASNIELLISTATNKHQHEKSQQGLLLPWLLRLIATNLNSDIWSRTALFKNFAWIILFSLLPAFYWSIISRVNFITDHTFTPTNRHCIRSTKTWSFWITSFLADRTLQAYIHARHQLTVFPINKDDLTRTFSALTSIFMTLLLVLTFHDKLKYFVFRTDWSFHPRGYILHTTTLMIPAIHTPKMTNSFLRHSKNITTTRAADTETAPRGAVPRYHQSDSLCSPS